MRNPLRRKPRPRILIHFTPIHNETGHIIGASSWLTIEAANGKTRLTSETYASLGNTRRAAYLLAADTGWDVTEEGVTP